MTREAFQTGAVLSLNTRGRQEKGSAAQAALILIEMVGDQKHL